VPGSVRVVLHGRRRRGVAAKDIVLHLLGRAEIRKGWIEGRLLEYCGDGVADLEIDERATLTNMAAEMGAFSALVAPDEITIDFLVARRGIERATAEVMCAGLAPDPGAVYEHTIEVDVGALRPMVALPGDPGNGVRVDELVEPVRIDIAFGGSCTASKAADMDMYAAVFRRALERNRGVHPEVECYIQLGSQEVRRHCEERGHLEVFRRAGVRVLEPGCGACCNAGPGVSVSPDQVTISSMNRNFPGRSGPGAVYLASPYTMAASAVMGRIVAFDAID